MDRENLASKAQGMIESDMIIMRAGLMSAKLCLQFSCNLHGSRMDMSSTFTPELALW